MADVQKLQFNSITTQLLRFWITYRQQSLALLVMPFVFAGPHALAEGKCAPKFTEVSAVQAQTLEGAFATFFRTHSYHPGECADDLKELILYLRTNVPSFDQEKAKVLTLYHFDLDWKTVVATTNFVHVKLRELGNHDYLYHVALEYDGKIYDPAFTDQPTVIDRDQYFEEMYFAKQEIKSYGGEDNDSPTRRERMLNKLNFFKIKSLPGLMQEIRVRVVTAKDYIERYYDRLQKMSGGTKYLWKGEEEDLASSRLGDYLLPSWKQPLPSPKGKGTYRIDTHHPEKEPTFVFPGGVEVFTSEAKLVLGDTQEVAKAVAVNRPGQEFPRDYNRKDRSLLELKTDFYPPEMLSVSDLQDKVVVDMACGGAQAVQELRALGLTVYGLDIALNERQKKHMMYSANTATAELFYLPKSNQGDGKYLIQADATQTGLAANQVDVIFDTFGIYYYEAGFNIEVVRAAYREWKRILKPGGVIRTSLVHPNQAPRIRALFADVGGYAEASLQKASGDPESDTYVIEFRKIR